MHDTVATPSSSFREYSWRARKVPFQRDFRLTGRGLAADNEQRMIRSILLRRRWRHAGEDTRESTQILSMGCITKEEVRGCGVAGS